jgi:serine/threonine protein kinase
LKYLIEKKISTGSFGTIYEVLGEADNKTYALKELKKYGYGLQTTF